MDRQQPPSARHPRPDARSRSESHGTRHQRRGPNEGRGLKASLGAVWEPWQQREPHGVVIRILLLGCDALEDPEEAARWRGGPLLGHHARQLRVVRDPLSTPRTTPPPSPAMTPAVLVPLIGSLPVISSDCRLCEATRLAPGQVPDLDQPTHGVGECVAQRAGLEVEFGAGR
jgi:hypothetical protein